MPTQNKIAALSYTALNTFVKCPLQFKLKFLDKALPFESSPALEYGNRVHRELELFFKQGRKLGDDLSTMHALCAALKAAGEAPGAKLLVEKAMAVDEAGNKCSYWSDDVWIRAKVDLCIMNEGGAHASVFDWKTGKRWVENEQLDLYAALMFAHFPKLKSVSTAFVWTKTGKMDSVRHVRSDKDRLLSWAMELTEEARIAQRDDAWEANPGFACKFCTASTDQCEEKVE